MIDDAKDEQYARLLFALNTDPNSYEIWIIFFA